MGKKNFLVFSYFSFSGRDSQGFSTYKDAASSEFLSKENGERATVKLTAGGESRTTFSFQEISGNFMKHSKVALKLLSEVVIRNVNTHTVSHRI